jgi:Ca2+-binding RTX toxin-like protein
LVRSGDRLEILDRFRGVIASYALPEVHSLTLLGGANLRTRLVVDLARGGSFDLPGGIIFRGSTGQQDALRLVLGNGLDRVHISGNQARLNDQLAVRWSGVEVLAVESREGNDLLSIQGTPLAQGTVVLQGGLGDDTYRLATRSTSVWIQDSGGIDTLDWAAALSGVQVDLTSSRFQTLDAVGNRLRLDGTIENVLGSRFADYLFGGPGRNILIGGAGADVLLGRGGEDILIGGTVSWDDNGLSFQALAAEWHSSRAYAERVQNLIDGTGSPDRLNGDMFLDRSVLADDGEADWLFGGVGRDWFVPFSGDRIGDRETGERAGG